MYHVIIVLDSSRNKSYYYSYTAENGNIKCVELPPYQDTNKARSCYWDAENSAWVYDEEKYQEIIAEQAEAKTAAEQARLEAAAVPSNEELAEAVLEIASGMSDINDAIAELAAIVSGGKGGE